MTAPGIDPTMARKARLMAANGQTLQQIGNATGLLDNEIRRILDEDRASRDGDAQQPRTPGAVTPHAVPLRQYPANPAQQGRPAPQSHSAVPGDHIAALIDRAEASDIGKVRTAARRVVTAIDHLREVMKATEQERRAKAEAKARAEKEAAEAAEKERVARVTVEALERQLQQAKQQLAAIRPVKATPRKYNLTPEDRERRRKQALAMAEAQKAKREAAKATP